MMNNELRPYENYKSIDLPWLNSIPEHWSVSRNKNMMFQAKSLVGDNHHNYKLLSLTLNGVIARDMVNPKGKFPKEFDTYQIVREKDLVFCLFDIDETPRTVGISPLEGMITGAYTVFNVKNANERYLYYYYLALDNNKMLKPLYTGLRKVVSADTFLRTKLPVPPRSEQDKIVKYLDHQLAKINKFIKAKKKLIAVLKEQKQAIINEVVTKGLDSNVKMKPSGIEWLGDVPEHWGISRNKNIMKVKKVIVGDNHKEYKLLSLTVNGVIVRDISSGKGKFPSDFSTYQRVDNGDLVFCLFDVDETPRTVGCAYDTGMITGAYTVFEVKPEIRDYVYFYYLAIDNKKSLKPLYTGLRKVVPTDSFLRSKIAIPPLGEINRIVHYINERTEAIDNSMKLIENEISLLMEYKNSLISDVVTGKVDVRNIVIEELEEEIIEGTELDEDSIDEEVLEAEDGDE